MRNRSVQLAPDLNIKMVLSGKLKKLFLYVGAQLLYTQDFFGT